MMSVSSLNTPGQCQGPLIHRDQAPVIAHPHSSFTDTGGSGFAAAWIFVPRAVDPAVLVKML